jgi:hypothetical protein
VVLYCSIATTSFSVTVIPSFSASFSKSCIPSLPRLSIFTSAAPPRLNSSRASAVLSTCEPRCWNRSATSSSSGIMSFSPAFTCSCVMPSRSNACSCAWLPSAAFTIVDANRVSPVTSESYEVPVSCAMNFSALIFSVEIPVARDPRSTSST